ncbi:NAD(P)/FAD-dependent oxidoreductase [Leifsonia poae]|uniref:NAD(P)/FAD-dependent oxidoreductase n=1 Tax=Leifsonia poae TaxID=110933 RepID=UPI001CBF641B|nr:NAD(P)/FAD-dependent oxidoreductase [Leifsonia poae]
MNETAWDALIVGGGSAGLSAALMLVRSRRRVLVLHTGEPRNGVAPHMHGVLGRDGASPLRLLADGRREVEAYGGSIRLARAVDVERQGGGLLVTTASGEREWARRLVVASGMRDGLPALPGLAEHWGTGVVTCPYCDGWEVRDRRLGVLATSEFSLHQAQLLRQLSADVTYFTGGDLEPADADLAALTARGIRVERRRLERVVDEGGTLAGIETAEGEVVALDAIFVGTTPLPASELLDRLGTGWTLDDPTGRTSHPGVWAAGNVVNPGATVPGSMASGALAGAGVNADLVAEDVAAAVGAGS